MRAIAASIIALSGAILWGAGTVAVGASNSSPTVAATCGVPILGIGIFLALKELGKTPRD